MSQSDRPIPDQTMIKSLQAHGLLQDPGKAHFEMLTGGVSSDIWKVETGDSVYCVKRALSKLKVAADWCAPVERNRFEVAWYRIANDLAPVLETGRKVYVEYANEVWNWDFPVYDYTTDAGCTAYPLLDCNDPAARATARESSPT